MMAEREREKTNHPKEAAFALSEEVEIPGGETSGKYPGNIV